MQAGDAGMTLASEQEVTREVGMVLEDGGMAQLSEDNVTGEAEVEVQGPATMQPSISEVAEEAGFEPDDTGIGQISQQQEVVRDSSLELQDAEKVSASEAEVANPVELETDKVIEESELRSSKAKLIAPADLELTERPAAETAKAGQSQQIALAQPQPGQKSGGKRVAENNRENVFESLTRMNESIFGLEGMKKAAAWYIETSEKLANQAIELQEQAMGWAKDTPLGPLFETQNSLARKFVERSASAARALWQIQPAQ
jgi:hypothetical protein